MIGLPLLDEFIGVCHRAGEPYMIGDFIALGLRNYQGSKVYYETEVVQESNL